MNIRATDDIDPILVENVEIVNIDARAVNTQVDGSVFFGVEQWWSNASRENLTINDVAELATVGMKGSHGIAGGAEATLTVNFDVDVTADEDELDVVFDTVSVRPTSDGNVVYDNLAAATTALILKNVDTLNVTADGAAATIADIISIMALPDSTVGLSTINLMSDGGALTATDISIDTDTGDDFALTVNMTSDGAAVTVSDISVNGGGDDTTEITINSTGDTANVVTDIAVANNAAFETLTITGDQDLTIAAGGAELAIADDVTIDASEFTGDLALFVARTDGGTETYTVELGSGDAAVNIDTVGTGGLVI